MPSHYERAAQALAAHWSGRSADARLAGPLLALSLGHLTLGMGAAAIPSLKAMAGRRDAHLVASLTVLQGVGSQMKEPLHGWVEKATPEDVAAFQASLVYVADMPLREMADEEDSLGVIYELLRGRYDRSSSGSYFTPLSVAEITARMTIGDELPNPGASFHDPACGTGTMLLASARVIRSLGGDPSNYCWYGQDLDPMACALCTVNLVSRGLVVPVRQ